MDLAMETDGVTSGIAAELSQKLKDLHKEFRSRFLENRGDSK